MGSWVDTVDPYTQYVERYMGMVILIRRGTGFLVVPAFERRRA